MTGEPNPMPPDSEVEEPEIILVTERQASDRDGANCVPKNCDPSCPPYCFPHPCKPCVPS